MRGKVILALAAALALALTACGGGGDSSESGSNGGAAIPSGAAGNTIAVSLGETGPHSMYMNLSQSSMAAGDVTFVVTNEGQKEHEMLVLKTDTPADQFPIMPKEAMGGEEMGHGHDIDEEAPGIEVVDEVADLAAGATDQLTVTLEPGHYALICNIRGHYSGGMLADFTVT